VVQHNQYTTFMFWGKHVTPIVMTVHHIYQLAVVQAIEAGT